MGHSQNKSELQPADADGILSNSLVVSFSLKGELLVHSQNGQQLKAEEVIAKLSSSHRLAKEIAIVWVPTQKIVMTEVIVPGKRKVHWMAALPFALEESLAESIESYHIVHYHRAQDGLMSVAVASHEDMKNWKRVLESFGLQHAQLVPDCFRLENKNGELAEDSQNWAVYQQDNCMVVRTSAYQGFAGNADWYQAIKGQAVHQHYLKNKEMDFEINETKVDEPSLLTSHAQNLIKVLPLSLSQLAYKTNASQKGSWYEWRWVAGLAVITLGVYLVTQVIQTQQLQQQATYVQAQNTHLFKAMFPQAQRIVNIKSQALTYLKQTNKTATDTKSVMAVLQVIEPWFNQAKTVTVEQLQWQADKKQKALTLNVTAPSSKELEQVISLYKESNNRQVTMTLSLKSVSNEEAKGVIYVDAN